MPRVSCVLRTRGRAVAYWYGDAALGRRRDRECSGASGNAGPRERTKRRVRRLSDSIVEPTAADMSPDTTLAELEPARAIRSSV